MTGVPTDAMSDVLGLVRLSGELVCIGSYPAPWSLGFGDPLGHFHVVQQGTAWLMTPENPPLALQAGDVVILPRGLGHTVASDPALPPVPIAQALADDPADGLLHRPAGPGARTEVVCGRFSLSGVLADRVRRVLPAVLHVAGRAAVPGDGLNVTTRYLVHEAQNPSPGTAIMIDRLLDLMFIQAVRDWGARSAGDLSWLGGLRDPRIGRALSAIHRDPARDWTVAALAAQAGLSRSAFATRFTQVVGQPPLRYVAAWRLDRAADHLRTGALRIAQIATLTGYGSEAALSRAFRAQFGLSPSAFRRTGR